MYTIKLNFYICVLSKPVRKITLLLSFAAHCEITNTFSWKMIRQAFWSAYSSSAIAVKTAVLNSQVMTPLRGQTTFQRGLLRSLENTGI